MCSHKYRAMLHATYNLISIKLILNKKKLYYLLTWYEFHIGLRIENNISIHIYFITTSLHRYTSNSLFIYVHDIFDTLCTNFFFVCCSISMNIAYSLYQNLTRSSQMWVLQAWLNHYLYLQNIIKIVGFLEMKFPLSYCRVMWAWDFEIQIQNILVYWFMFIDNKKNTRYQFLTFGI